MVKKPVQVDMHQAPTVPYGIIWDDTNDVRLHQATHDVILVIVQARGPRCYNILHCERRDGHV
jgi:hypothetical protein